MPVEDLTLPSLDLRALARRAAVPAAAAVALVAAVMLLGGPLETFADAVRRAIDADPAWVLAAAVFELLSFGGYIMLLWLVGSRVSSRLGLRESTVKWHVNIILSRLGVSDRTEAIVEALQRGILHLP